MLHYLTGTVILHTSRGTDFLPVSLIEGASSVSVTMTGISIDGGVSGDRGSVSVDGGVSGDRGGVSVDEGVSVDRGVSGDRGGMSVDGGVSGDKSNDRVGVSGKTVESEGYIKQINSITSAGAYCIGPALSAHSADPPTRCYILLIFLILL